MKQTPQAGLCFRQDRAEPGRSNGEPDFHEHSATETGNNLAAWLSHESRPGRTFISLIVALIYSPRAPRTEERNASASIGLARKANAPAFKANVRISQSGRTVMIITFVFGDTQYSCFAIESAQAGHRDIQDCGSDMVNLDIIEKLPRIIECHCRDLF
jgi:hypothetical protein